MKKLTAFILIFLLLITAGGCGNYFNDPAYDEYLSLINQAKYEDAYRKLDEFQSAELAADLRKQFTVLENVMLSQEVLLTGKALQNNPEPIIYTYHYDTQGRLVEIQDVREHPNPEFCYNPYNEVAWFKNHTVTRQTIVYDKNGLLLSVNGYNNSSLQFKNVYFVDKDGVIYQSELGYIQIYSSSKYDTWVTEQTIGYEYDETGKLTHYTINDNDAPYRRHEVPYADDGKPRSKYYERVYDENGRLSGLIYANGQGTAVFHYGTYYAYSPEK